ncbi:MAG: right-handed parallel beta-helix repeat-containing protein, partial [Candidatus Zixiibacteriota bacterium]
MNAFFCKSGLIILALLFGCSTVVNATILKVPEDYISIQAGINAAAVGDTVSVLNMGTYPYTESITINKGIMLVTRAGTAKIEAIPDRRVITILDCSDTVKVIGFDISNGAPSGDTPDDWGGGILVYNAPAAIEYCYIHDNIASGSSGGGVCFRAGAYVILRNNFVYNNSADFGGGIMASTGHIGSVIENNVIHNNTSLQTGGGVWLYDATYNGAQGDFRNNTIVGNHAGLLGCGLQTHNVDATALYNIIAYNHQAGTVVDDSAGVWIGNYSMINWDCNDVFGNCGGNNYHNIYPGPDEISADPEFCDTTESNYYLTANSPCLSENNGCSALIGALEEGCEQNVWYVDVNSEEIYGNGSFELPFHHIPEAVSVAGINDTILVYPGTYHRDEPYQMYTYLNIIDKELTIKSVGGPDVTSIVTLTWGETMATPVININNCSLNIEGFTIHGTTGIDPGQSVLEIDGSNISMYNCNISGGYSVSGTAIDCKNSRISMTNCRVLNTVQFGSPHGGGICTDSDCVYLLVDSCIFKKTVDIDAPGMGEIKGGAIYSMAESTIVTNSTFDSVFSILTSMPDMGSIQGGVIWVSSPYINIMNNILSNNDYNGYDHSIDENNGYGNMGIGIYVAGTGIVSHNTIANNRFEIFTSFLDSAYYDSLLLSGGAIFSNSPDIEFTDNILTNNVVNGSGILYPGDTLVQIKTAGGGFSGRYSLFDSNLVWGNYPDEIYHPYGPDSIPEY